MKYLLLLLSFSVQADAYFELAIGVNTTNGLPEVNLPAPLGKFVLGWEAQDNWSVEYEHISSIQLAEEGKGLNVIWFNKRVYF